MPSRKCLAKRLSPEVKRMPDLQQVSQERPYANHSTNPPSLKELCASFQDFLQPLGSYGDVHIKDEWRQGRETREVRNIGTVELDNDNAESHFLLSFHSTTHHFPSNSQIPDLLLYNTHMWFLRTLRTDELRLLQKIIGCRIL
jgi:hypothetical protein